MAANQVEILIRSYFDSAGIVNATKAFKNLQSAFNFSPTLQGLQAPLASMGYFIDEATNRVRNTAGEFVSLSDAIDGAAKRQVTLNQQFENGVRGATQLSAAFGGVLMPQQEQEFSMPKTRSFDLFNDGVAGARKYREELIMNAFLTEKLGVSLASLKNLGPDSKKMQEFHQLLQSGAWEKFNNDIMKSRKRMKEFGMDASTVRSQFQMEFLGIMFFGMMLKQSLESLAKSTTSSFMKITEGATSQGQAITALQVSWELLKFSIGEAIGSVLEALLPTILPIIMAITDWIQQHQKLVGWLIIGGIVIGTLLYMVGQMVLGFSSLAQGISKVAALFAGEGSIAAGATATSMSFMALLGWILIIIAIAAVLWAAWQTNFGGIRDFTTNTFGIIWETIKTVLKSIWDIIKTVLDILVAVFKGDWKRVWELTRQLFAQLVGLIAKALLGILSIAANVLLFFYNIVKDSLKSIIKLFITWGSFVLGLMIQVGGGIVKALVTPLNWVIGKINSVINALAKIPGAPKWLKSLKIPTVTENAINSVTDGLRGMVTQLEQTANTKVDSVFERLTAGYVNKDVVSGAFASIDAMVEKYKTTANNLTPNLDTESTSTDDNKLMATLSQTSTAMAGLAKQTEVAKQTSESMVQQNTVEAESWRLKNDELEKYMSSLKEYQSLVTTRTAGTGVMDMSKDVPNFALRNTVG